MTDTEQPTRTYERDGFKVHWYAERCIHSAACIRAQPEVFRPNDRPWIHIDAGERDGIEAAVAACPSGALQFEAEGVAIAAAGDVVIAVEDGGPLNVRGNVRIEDDHGNVIAEGARFALCRCGQSGNKPFCDNSHFRLA